jgi:hypothetical protein
MMHTFERPPVEYKVCRVGLAPPILPVTVVVVGQAPPYSLTMPPVAAKGRGQAGVKGEGRIEYACF